MTFSELPIEFSGGARGAKICGRGQADQQARELGATLSHCIVFKNWRPGEPATWLSSVSYLRDVTRDKRGRAVEGAQIAYWNPDLEIFCAFENPRRYVTPLTAPEVETPVTPL